MEDGLHRLYLISKGLCSLSEMNRHKTEVSEHWLTDPLQTNGEGQGWKNADRLETSDIRQVKDDGGLDQRDRGVDEVMKFCMNIEPIGVAVRSDVDHGSKQGIKTILDILNI